MKETVANYSVVGINDREANVRYVRLQFQEGCAAANYNMTPGDAVTMGMNLIKIGQETIDREMEDVDRALLNLARQQIRKGKGRSSFAQFAEAAFDLATKERMAE